jgi:protein-tyrosine phosphatase
MIDVHCHLLPGIDDGSRSHARSVEVLTRFAAEGVTDVVLTPHLSASEAEARGAWRIAQRQRVLHELRAEAPAQPTLHVGFEIMLDEVLPAIITNDRRYALAGSRYYLVEFHPSVAADVSLGVLERVVAAGVVPIVAHPERYADGAPPVVAAWRETGARVQLDATTLTRPSARGVRARAYLAAGLADIIAADNHGDVRSLKAAVAYLTSHGHAEAARLLAVENPRAIVEDRPLAAVPPVRIRESWVAALTRLFER